MARSSFSSVAIRYVFPVLFMTSLLAIVGRMAIAALRYRGRVWCLSMPCYSAPVKQVRSINYDQPVCVCLSVCLRAYLWNNWTDLREIFVQIPCGRGSVLLRPRCGTACTSGFMDDVMFGGRCGTKVESDVYECLVCVLVFCHSYCWRCQWNVVMRMTLLCKQCAQTFSKLSWIHCIVLAVCTTHIQSAYVSTQVCPK